MHVENSSNFGVRDHYSYVLGGMHPETSINEKKKSCPPFRERATGTRPKKKAKKEQTVIQKRERKSSRFGRPLKVRPRSA